MLEKSSVRLLQVLYRQLFEKVMPAINQATAAAETGKRAKLTIVPHGLLHQVPFHALHDGDAYMIDRYEIAYAPSATVWALCCPAAVEGQLGALAVGVADDEIPAAAQEARMVAAMVGDGKALIGSEALCATVLAEMADRRVLHFACHGLFRSDNPMFSALKLHDGWLTAGDVMRANLSASLVTLSACESGRSEVIGGDEVLGLTRAFLGAGAASLVVSLWLVHDEAALQLMERLYANLSAGMSRVAALRMAQLELRETHPHPYYWAPFVLVGRH
jgi:CHAT domain-containing protein